MPLPGFRAHPATSDRWPDVECVMQDCANGRKCWCAYWYLPNADFKAGWGAANKAPLYEKVKAGAEPGIVAYVDDAPAAWVSVAPRTNFDRLNRSKNFAPVDDLPVWAINCFVVAKGFRRKGLMDQLILAASDFAFAKGAPAVESYPVAPGPKTGSSDLYLGTEAAFLRAGFTEVARPLPRRPIMRKRPK